MNRLLRPTSHIHALREVIELLTRHRQLTLEMARREIADRYVGQVFGMLWAIGHPLVIIGIYVFIFAFVFKVRINSAQAIPLDYTVYLLSGLIPWMAFQESMSKGTTVIVGNANLVKQVVFPIEVLPVKAVIASFLTQSVSMGLLTVYVLLKYRALPWTYALLPLLFFLQLSAMVGISFALSSVGVYFRDLKDFVQVLTLIGVYLMPIFYLPSMVPGLFRPLLFVNPFSYMIWCYQDACYFGRIQHPWAWAVFASSSIGVFYIGYRLFRKLKIMFGNVL
jgi:lipopolysaccharide transport system permease protein